MNTLQSSPMGLLALGIIVSAASAADLVFGWAEKAARHAQCEERFGELLRRAFTMDLLAIDQDLVSLQTQCKYENASTRSNHCACPP